MNFVHLNIETNFNMNGSNIRLEELINQAISYGYSSLAITDSKMYGAIKFYKLCKKSNVKPIFGLSVELEGISEGARNSILLYAKNNIGYQNLLQISSLYSLNGTVSFKEVETYKQGLIGVVITDASELIQAYRNQQENFIHEFKDNMNRILEKWYVSISATLDFNQSLQSQFSFIVVPKVRYLEKKDKEISDLLSKILGSKQEDLLGEAKDNHFLTNKEATELYQKYQDAMNNTMVIANMCDVTLRFDQVHLPKYKLKQKVSAKDYLHVLAFKGLEKRLKGLKVDKKKYIQRLDYELKVIDEMGYNDYFLIVWDFVKYARQNKYLVGPGRGSAAASLVSYCLGITSVDSIAHDLVFERFLNPERITLPDIDMDIPDDKRDDVIRYVRDFYGVGHVASICTFGTFQSKSAIRDTARVLDFQGVLLSQLTKESDKYSSIVEMLEQSEMVQNIISQNNDAKQLLEYASKIEGLNRHVSTHAAGIIVADQEIIKHTPVQPGLLDMMQTQYEAKDLEELGLLKIDFLGLRNLTSIDQICDLIRENEQIDLDIYKVPLTDQKTFELLKKVDVTGVFQLESRGMRSLIGQMQIDCFEDIVAILALFRPGPMENIPTYIKRRNKEEKVTYPHKILEDVLKPTHGIIVYQEQIIQIANLFAGYSLGEADVLRRAVSKKSEDILQKERIHFLNKAKQLGRDTNTSNEIYDYIVKFANYGFNKAHSVAYAMVSYWMAYLKANYPKYFVSILTTSVIGSKSMMEEYIYEANKLGVSILKPSVNYSTHIFQPEKEHLRFPLLGIKNIGRNTVNDLLTIRQEGLFQSFYDFVSRCHKVLNKRVIESLIYAGALDEFKMTKRTMIEHLEEVINFSLYGDFISQEEFVIKNVKEYSYTVLKDKEKEILGFNLFMNPLVLHQEYILKHKLITPSQISEEHIDQEIRFVAILSRIRKITTKTKQDMAFVTLEDTHFKINGVLFASTYQKFHSELEKNHVYLFKGKLENRNNEQQIIINNVHKL